MQTAQKIFTFNKGWEDIKTCNFNKPPQIVFAFGSVKNFQNEKLISDIIQFYPNSILIGCTTSGEIGNNFVVDNSIVVTAVLFEKSTVQTSFLKIENAKNSFDIGNKLIAQIEKENLKHIFILSEGLNVNGSQLVLGMQNNLPENVNITGGLAGDADLFTNTFILHNNGKVDKNIITALSIYGNEIKVGYGSYGGWDIFGVERLVTKSENNILYEIDNTPALALYKSFLGIESKNLPASALLFPLSLRVAGNNDEQVVRTILAVNEKDQSLTFAGDIPEGSHIKLMKANIDRLIDGAVVAAERAMKSLQNVEPEFGLLISCVGRKIVLNQLVEEEIDGVKNVLGENVLTTGFYSYGEIAPFEKNGKCALHNQTMTITLFTEK